MGLPSLVVILSGGALYLRADIDYGFAEARTTYGVIGVKCWVYKGEILRERKREPQAATTGAF